MNLLHMKYALAIAETKSLNKAAETLLVGAPALSRAIKELEASLGVTLFDRSAKGMFLTPDGELFVEHAQKALRQVDDIENLFREGRAVKQHFSVSVPRAAYIADAFTRFSKKLDRYAEAEILYRETNASRVIKNVLQEDYRLGILRYSEQYDGYYTAMMNEKNLSAELITAFQYVMVMRQDSPLNALPEISLFDLQDYIEIAHGDPYVPSLSVSEVKKAELPVRGHCRIFVFERASQFELLSQNRDTYMWVSAMPQGLLDRYGLVQRTVSENKRRYRDVLIHRRDYALSALDELFIEELFLVKQRLFGTT